MWLREKHMHFLDQTKNMVWCPQSPINHMILLLQDVLQFLTIIVSLKNGICVISSCKKWQPIMTGKSLNIWVEKWGGMFPVSWLPQVSPMFRQRFQVGFASEQLAALSPWRSEAGDSS
jgi:hypothetical protein